MRIVQISDTHLSHRGGTMTDDLEQLIGLINELDPDLVVHSGDVVVLDPDNGADRAAAEAVLSKIDAPLRLLPGNHDVGEPGDKPWAGLGVTSERVTAFTGVFGDDHWLETVGDWAVIGFNSEILGSGLPEEDAQWEWLEALPQQLAGRPVLAFCHKPLWAPMDFGADYSLTVPAPQRERLLAAWGEVNLKAVGTGHLHYFGTSERQRHDGEQVCAVAAPPTGFVNPQLASVWPGIVQQGFVEYQLGERGPQSVRPLFRTLHTLRDEDAEGIPAFRAAMADLGIDKLI